MTIFAILFGYIPIIFGLVGGSIYMIDTIRQICMIRKLKKQKNDIFSMFTNLAKNSTTKDTDL